MSLRFLLAALAFTLLVTVITADSFVGQYYSGEGDVEYLQLLDIAKRMWGIDPEYQTVPMLYYDAWNALIEGPTWKAWWSQNSYGTTWTALPFLQEPLLTFVQNSQNMWFLNMGNGTRNFTFDGHQYYTAPDGALCDMATADACYYKQGDGNPFIHDWTYEESVSCVVMQAELLLVSRDINAIKNYLPYFLRLSDFVEEKRDGVTNLFLVGPASNLLAPSYAGWGLGNGRWMPAYLSGLSITYTAALDKMIELTKMVGDQYYTDLYTRRRDTTLQSLSQLLTPDGKYFLKSLDPNGTMHGLYGQDKFGYFEASPNHDAVAFRVVNDSMAQNIFGMFEKLRPNLMPYNFTIANYPSLDDMYTAPEGLWRFGYWVNGGAWSTCEARMIMAYYRMGLFDYAKSSMWTIVNKFAKHFRMDNPLTDFGNDVYQPNEPINLTYDAFGIASAFIRGLFEYLYFADYLLLVPHVPPSILYLNQTFPIRFGSYQIYLSIGRESNTSTEITSVTLNNSPWKLFNSTTVSLPIASLPADQSELNIFISYGSTIKKPSTAAAKTEEGQKKKQKESSGLFNCTLSQQIVDEVKNMSTFVTRMKGASLGSRYEALHAEMMVSFTSTIVTRCNMLNNGTLAPLPDSTSQAAADQSYVNTTLLLYSGLASVLSGYRNSADPTERLIYKLWTLPAQRKKYTDNEK